MADFQYDRTQIAATSRLVGDSLAPRERIGVTPTLAALTVMGMETLSEHDLEIVEAILIATTSERHTGNLSRAECFFLL